LPDEAAAKEKLGPRWANVFLQLGEFAPIKAIPQPLRMKELTARMWSVSKGRELLEVAKANLQRADNYVREYILNTEPIDPLLR